MNEPFKKIDVFNSGILAGMDATEIAKRIREKDITVQEAVDCVRERAEDVNAELNAIVTDDYELYLNKFKADGPFAGVPMYIKDLIHVKGFHTQWGSDAVPPVMAKKNDAYINQFNETGCIIVGKSATSEFGLLPSSETKANGDTKNPWNTAYSTGGSSGGAGALAAAGVVPMAHAMDGGGSIRIPASCCGLIGLKPSRGRHVGSPTKPLPVDIVTNGMVTRTVRDTANYFAAVESYQIKAKLPKIGKITGPGHKRLKIGVITENPANMTCDQDVERAVLKAAKICEDLGHHVEYIKNPYSDKILLDFLVYYAFLGFLTVRFGKINTGSMKFKASRTEPFTRGLNQYFGKFLMTFPSSVRHIKSQVNFEYDSLMHKYDVAISPTLQGSTPKLANYSHEQEFISCLFRLNNYVNYTIVQNATGAPAISLPMSTCKNDMPIGVQFAAEVGGESKLLELAFELEQAGSFII